MDLSDFAKEKLFSKEIKETTSDKKAERKLVL